MSQLVAGCLGDCAVFDAGIPAGVRGRVGGDVKSVTVYDSNGRR